MELDASVVWDFAGELVGTLTQRKGSTLATVTRIDPDGTTWVTTDGNGEAPAVGVAAGVAVGDTVALEWDGATMGIRANVSDPAPTGAVVRHAQRVASAAQKVAEAVNQHFFTDTHGIHVTEATQEDWEQSHMGPNVLINSLGQLFRDGLNNLLTLTTENGARALTIWDGAGNAAANVLAVFGEIVRIGRSTDRFIEIDDAAIRFFSWTGSRNQQDAAITGGSIEFGLSKLGGAATAVPVTFFYNLPEGSIPGVVAPTPLYADSGGDTTTPVYFWNGMAHLVNIKAEQKVYASNGQASLHGSTDSIYLENNGTGGLWRLYCEQGGNPNVEWSDDGGTSWKTVVPMIECGSVGQTTSVPAGGYADVNVTFDRPYDSTPTVVVGMLSTSTSSEIGLCSVALESASATGFTARLFNAGASARRPSFCWIAMG